MNDIVYKEKYIDLSEIKTLRSFYSKKLKDRFSGGPFKTDKNKFGFEGCWDRPLHLEIKFNPVHRIIKKLQQDFGPFEIHISSIRYLSFPFIPHTDIKSSDWLLEQRKKYKPGYTFLIPLWWHKKNKPGTAFFSSPPEPEQKLYNEKSSILPKFGAGYENWSRNLGIKKIIYWQNYGDLIAWKSFQWHCSLTQPNFYYSDKRWCKEFISIETSIKI